MIYLKSVAQYLHVIDGVCFVIISTAPITKLKLRTVGMKVLLCPVPDKQPLMLGSAHRRKGSNALNRTHLVLEKIKEMRTAGAGSYYGCLRVGCLVSN